MSVHREVSSIIEKTKEKPNIVNEESNFVVITYWWGSGRLNRNTARPCTSFYEDNLKKINNFILNLLAGAENQKNFQGDLTFNTIFSNLQKNPTLFVKLNEFIANKMLNDYINRAAEEYKIDPKIKKIDEKFTFLKEQELFDNDLTYEKLVSIIIKIIINGILLNKENLINLYKVQKQVNEIKAMYNKLREKSQLDKFILFSINIVEKCIDSDCLNTMKKDIINKQKNIDDKKLVDLLDTIKDLASKKEKLSSELIKELKKKHNQVDGSLKNIFDLLIETLEYKPPIKFEEMIENWNKLCEKNNCNYLSVEYNEFTREGGYQLAINAKPKFIQKALELCYPRSVLYIDGDMTIRKYPGIFDMKNIDFMARGWYIDPRSSWNFDDSITYDPYDFETSGGIMFFSSSEAAKKLLELWIITSEKSINDGKADDRVLSLVFNTKAVLTWSRIIQLPVEYLWLTLDFNERMLGSEYCLENVYNRKKGETLPITIEKMQSSIIVDHPECLTSEDTATGAGAASSRQPKFSEFLYDETPSVEITHEYIMFNELKEYKHFESQEKYLPYFNHYYKYMSGLQYKNDGNPELVDMGLVDPTNEENNVYPLYIVPFTEIFGEINHPRDDMKLNEVAQFNLQHMNKKFDPLLQSLFQIFDNMTHYEIIIKTQEQLKSTELFHQILYLLKTEKKPVLYNPKNIPENKEYDTVLYKKLKTNIFFAYKDIDFVFNPIHRTSIKRSDFFKPNINLMQPILFKYEERFFNYLLMQLSLGDLSEFLSENSYYFMSLVRVGYAINKDKKTTLSPETSEYYKSRYFTSASGKKKKLKPFNMNKIIKDYMNVLETPVGKLNSILRNKTIKNNKKSKGKKTKRR